MRRELTHLHIETGPAGWLKAFWRRGGVENVIYARLRPPRAKRDTWTIVGLEVSKGTEPPRLTAELLDDIPVHRIERAVATSTVFKDGLRDHIGDEPPANLDSAFPKHYEVMERTKLARPSRAELNDDFFRKVAHAYRQAVAQGLPPGETMATDSGIPRGTINRWIAEARKRKFLPSGGQGKVTTV